jgi:hypothetical protein
VKVGSLVNIIHSLSESSRCLDGGNVGKTGIILSEYEHRSATCGRPWYTVMIQGKPKAFREDYLEAV